MGDEKTNERLATVVAETEPFFRDVMKVYIDLLCRGDHETSRELFSAGVRFAGAVQGLKRTAPRERAAEAARAHLQRCLYVLWKLPGREQTDTGPLFERGLALLAALRAVAHHPEQALSVPP
jgi:hypothetical protein